MFTVKLLSSQIDGSISTSIACPRYSVYEREAATSETRRSYVVTVYPSIHDGEGIEYEVNDQSGGFSSCFVENISGKTIDSVYGYQTK